MSTMPTDSATRAAINAHHAPLIAAAERNLAASVADFEAGYGEDYPGAIDALRVAVTDANLARLFDIADRGLGAV